MRLAFLLATLALSGALLFFHQLALAEYLYWKYSWFDSAVHFLGGATLGMFIAALSRHFRPWLFLGFIVFGSVGWEVFEFILGVSRTNTFILDTATDLLMDTLGALLVYAILRLTLWRSK